MRKIKIIYAVMLFACLIDFPYGYFQLVRFIGMFLFGYLAFENLQNNQSSNKGIIFLVLAVLFQPLFKISFGRGLWNLIDVIVGIGLLLDAFSNNQKWSKNL